MTTPTHMPVMVTKERYPRRLPDYVPSGYLGIPWSVIAPHERQARSNHGQSLERLAERGGLGPCEAVAILEDRPWHRMDQAEAFRRMLELSAEG